MLYYSCCIERNIARKWIQNSSSLLHHLVGTDSLISLKSLSEGGPPGSLASFSQHKHVQRRIGLQHIQHIYQRSAFIRSGCSIVNLHNLQAHLSTFKICSYCWWFRNPASTNWGLENLLFLELYQFWMPDVRTIKNLTSYSPIFLNEQIL